MATTFDSTISTATGRAENPADALAVPITLRINGKEHALRIDPRTTLLDCIRETVELTGAKKGCDHGQCGACTIHVDGRRVLSCLSLALAHDGKEITTLEGLGTPERPHPIQRAFIDEQAAQCGFCLNGVILTAKAFVDQNRRATDDQIEQALSGVLCRCFAHTRMLRAIRRYAQEA